MVKIPMENKSPEMKALIEGFFPGTAAKIAAHICPMCEQPIGEFKDEASVREYEISGLCQSCQDDFFGNVYSGEK